MTTTTAALAQQTPAEIDAQLFPILEKLDLANSYVAEGRKRLEENRLNQWQRRDIEKRLAEHEAEAEARSEEAKPFEDEYTRRGGWKRYIVVQGGHLHAFHCHTLTPGRTMVGAVAEASGLDDPQVVGTYGTTACTHCFPDAPVVPKKTLAEEGMCEHSGQYVPTEKLPKDWAHRAVAPRVRCECGWAGAITPAGKYRRHKAGS